MGCATWPDKGIYSKCCVCGEEAERVRGVTPMTDDEAQSILLHHEFERYYERYCAERGIPVDGPLPEPEAELTCA
jgi:hypothetical protein